MRVLDIYSLKTKFVYMKETNSLHTQILAIICSVFDAYSATLYLPEEGSSICHLAATFTLGDGEAYMDSIGLNSGLAGEILSNKKPLVMTNFDKNSHSLGYYKNEDESCVKAFMACPVSSGGIICVDSKKLYSFSDKDSKILQLFADLVSVREDAQESMPTEPATIEEYFACLSIVRSLRFQFKAWPTFLQNYLSTVAHALRFDYCAFASLDPSEEYYVVEGETKPYLLKNHQQLAFPVQSGMVGWVFRDEQQAIFSEGLTGNTTISLFGKIPEMPHYQAIICVPIMVNKSARGVLCLAHSEGREMDETLRSFVYQCVDYLGLFLENLYLRSRLHQYLPKAELHDQAAHYDGDCSTHGEES